MTCSSTLSAACGTSDANTQFEMISASGAPRRSEAATTVASNPLERLAQLMISNDRLMDELVTSRARIVAARNYLDNPGCNARFGAAHLERCRAKHSGILAQLRANRIEALQLLGKEESGA